MSATTILESYDTQMDYSGDFDVAMHTAGSSADTWPYLGETIMDQDAHHDSQSTGAADRESVEVDMEGTYPDHPDHESVEYEMADEEEIYQREGGDLLDIEVYDASRLQSPVPMPATINTPQMTSGELVDFTTHATPVFTDPHNSVEASRVLREETDVHGHSANELPAIEIISDSSPRFEAHEVPAAATASTKSHTEHLVDSSTHVQAIANDLPHAALETEVTGEVTTSSNSGVSHAEDSGHAHKGETELAPTWSHLHLDQPTDAEQHGSEEFLDGFQQFYEYNETALTVADPHEISEGVYIDPPPAVLLSLPASDQPEICLFNQPPTRAGSLSPTEETRQPGQQALMLLLHHRPTLYYEPLTNVFEALRQEEYIMRIPEFAEGELALDAYDLQLIVSEDNAHAREVTLHDLNVLHDGSDLVGPLRLQLHVVVPRFILRYHMLRDQIARLNLAAEGGEEGEEVATDKEHYDEHAEEYHAAEGYQQENPQSEQNDEDHEGQQSDQQYTEQSADPTKPDSTDEQATGDISNLTAEDHDYHQVHGAEVQAVEDENEFADADADTGADLHEEAGENRDTDADHSNGDSAVVTAVIGDLEPTGYEDYTEALDYDERHGEVVLEQEDDDGEADSDQTSRHHGAADDEEPTNVDNAREALPEPDVLKAPSAVDLAQPTREEPAAREDHSAEDDLEETFEEISNTDAEAASHDNLDHDSVGTVTKHGAPTPGIDESDPKLVAVFEHEANLTNPEAETSTSEPQKPEELELEYPDLDDNEWDDDLDAEGEIDPSWPVDHDDGVSNQSSTTLSSTTSIAKRGHDELDSEDELDGDGHSPQNSSPEPKRARVV